ncbi:hypothetical protein O181_079858 [Austropuccinia psidii MF-1]|uniref:Uncharacterized protein n=1 Tax=Austropuccinia psidii MF-1 TaxID=1389203 RepID=A0A9Q3IG09_9BASI|nr:hypothetical protein [Austropuccinia psidii MF-1]
MENAFESSISNSEKDKPLMWFSKQKDRLSASQPDMSDTIINMKILRKCGGELESGIKCRFVEHCQHRTTLTQWKISLLETELVKLGIKVLWSPKWSQIFPEKTEKVKFLP